MAVQVSTDLMDRINALHDVEQSTVRVDFYADDDKIHLEVIHGVLTYVDREAIQVTPNAYDHHDYPSDWVDTTSNDHPHIVSIPMSQVYSVMAV
jgi:hypothetical protein